MALLEKRFGIVYCNVRHKLVWNELTRSKGRNKIYKLLFFYLPAILYAFTNAEMQ